MGLSPKLLMERRFDVGFDKLADNEGGVEKGL